MDICRFCNDSDLSQIPYGICFECGNHGPKYVESMWTPYLSDVEIEESKERFRKEFCVSFNQRGIKKCNCQSTDFINGKSYTLE